MTAKELLLQEAPTWSEEQAERALRAVHLEPDAAIPGDIIDDWGNLSLLHRVSFGETMRRLASEEHAAGHESW